ncbi:hypothetical protein HID58_069947 [Brassica napus]|uniref:Uncharacterized protein n=1 Tax=Brassica napus TaxID=3708 RepID=A0ABQ7YXE1_BRANA|nr:hypothetical protein HID58_069947 [Brassica napus]
MMKIRTPKTHKAKRVLEQRVPKLVENGKKTLILDGANAKGMRILDPLRVVVKPLWSSSLSKLIGSIFAVIFVPPAPLHPHIYSNGHICLGISLSISFVSSLSALCSLFCFWFLGWMLLSAV